MQRVLVLADFTDLAEGVVRHAGDSFECSDERFADIDGKLPGYVRLGEAKAPRKAPARKTTAKR